MKKTLIVVDYQNDFVDGSLGFEGAKDIEEGIVNKITEYRKQGQEIIFTADTHGENYLSTGEGKNLPIKHCIKGTPGWRLYGRVQEAKLDEDLLLEKGAFGSLELGEYLRKGGFQEVELCGLVSNICVISNAVIAKAALPEAKVVVDARCTDSGDKEMNEKALDILEGIQVEVIGR